jgi:hypothetical protein
MGIKIFNSLPPYIKIISKNVRKFEICLKLFLQIHSFYSIKEYFQHKTIVVSWPCPDGERIMDIVLIQRRISNSG